MNKDAWEYTQQIHSPFFWFFFVIAIAILLTLGSILFSELYAIILANIFNGGVIQVSDGFFAIVVDSSIIVVEWECTFVWMIVIFSIFAIIKHGWKYVLVGSVIVFGLNLLRMVLVVYLGLKSFTIASMADNVLTLTYIIMMGIIFAFIVVYVVMK